MKKPSDSPAGTDPELAKKQAEQEAKEAADKQAQERKDALARKDNCERAKRSREVMLSGQMISHTNAQGQRGFMDEATRSREIARANQVIASDC